jgi:diguanylate cyclase (GGDEF)-like protein/PAS domain S-box-containing protein
MTGYDACELTGQTVFALIEFEEGQSAKEMSDQLALRGTWNGELAVTQKNGDDFPAGTRINRVDDPQSGMPAHYVWILADITERKQAEDRMRHIAQTDALTGLPNRMALLLRLAQLLPDARRHHWKVAMMFLDLDRFKMINDTLGHQVGDECCARWPAGCVEPRNRLVARLGGDEFVIILPAISTPADAACRQQGHRRAIDTDRGQWPRTAHQPVDRHQHLPG